MDKKYFPLLGIGVLATALIFLWRIPQQHELTVLQIPTVGTTTDRSNITPLGTPYVRPPEEKSSATTTQAGKIDEHLTIDNTLREVIFCGVSYQTKQVFIDGVDVIQRIAMFVAESNLDYMKGICSVAEAFRKNGLLHLEKNEIGVSPVIREESESDIVYRMNLVSPVGNFQHIGDFKIDVSTGRITLILQGFADFSEKPIGNLK